LEPTLRWRLPPPQVLKIVYGGDKPGLFYPKGMNGNIA
jgi:hypothetical protein